ncbi:MAG TPA: serine/threonine-protein kinase [Polyangiaceae bacterium]
MNAEARAPVAPGDVLAGKYRVERVLGAGAMGVVVAAMHMQLDQRVAIKFLLPDALTSEMAVGRFSREAKAAARIRSEHVVRVLDVSTLEGGEPFMVMEYLEGTDLLQLLGQRGALPVEEAVDYVLQALEALCEAHLAGIVHRDLKPSNMFLARRADGSPVVKILDFGISKIATLEQQAMTTTQAMLGSPMYMAPEQMRATKSVDRRADIWSMGVIIYQLLTARLPFVAETMAQLISTVMFDPTPRPSAVRPDLPPGMDDVVVRCLEKEADRRYANVGELTAALAPFAPPASHVSIDRVQRMLRGAGAELPAAAASGVNTPVPGVLPAFVSSEPVAQAWQATNGKSKADGRRARLVMAGAIGAVSVAAVTGAFLVGRHQSPTAEPPTSAGAAALTATATYSTPPVEAMPSATLAPEPSETPTAPAASASAPAASSSAQVVVPSRPRPTSPPARPSSPPPTSTSDFGGRH